MSKQIDLTFPHDYEVEILEELPGRAFPQTYYYPPGRKQGSFGLVVHVTPHAEKAWQGIVLSEENRVFVSSCPDPGEICLVAGSNGYIINVGNPGEPAEIPLSPITDVRPAPDHAVLVLADEITVGAWGRSGLVWRTGRLCWDELRILSIEDGVVRGEGWNPVEHRMVAFKVHLADGASEGGARPEDYSSRSRDLDAESS